VVENAETGSKRRDRRDHRENQGLGDLRDLCVYRVSGSGGVGNTEIAGISERQLRLGDLRDLCVY
jgi:hypothetical protein